MPSLRLMRWLPETVCGLSVSRNASEQDRAAEMTSDITEFDDKLVRKYFRLRRMNTMYIYFAAKKNKLFFFE